MVQSYEGRDRRVSTEAERQQWRDSHPYGVIAVAFVALLVAGFARALEVAAPTASPWVAIIREAAAWVFGSAAFIVVGQRLLTFLLDRAQKRVEAFLPLPERVTSLEELIKEGFERLALGQAQSAALQEARNLSIEHRLDLIENRRHR